MEVRSQFDRYAPILRDLPENFDEAGPLPAALRMRGDRRYEVFYAPFDEVNTEARVVLVGITPGKSQAVEAIRVARQLLRYGASNGQARRAAKIAASFGGQMRKNLVQMLDHVVLRTDLTCRLPASSGRIARTLCTSPPPFAILFSTETITTPAGRSRARRSCWLSWAPGSPTSAMHYLAPSSFRSEPPSSPPANGASGMAA